MQSHPGAYKYASEQVRGGSEELPCKLPSSVALSVPSDAVR